MKSYDPTMSFDVPIVLLVFNRPGNTRTVLDSIRSIRPRRLFVVADGPREGVTRDRSMTEEVRRAIVDGVDWPCELDLTFRDTNLGCARSVAEGLNHVFDRVEAAIVLEDDTVVAPDFYPFCAELLDRYRNDLRVGCIAASNFECRKQPRKDSYYFSLYPHCWGWATWRRAWSWYDHSMTGWPEMRESRGLCNILDGRGSVKYWTGIYDAVHADRIASWAYRWTYSLWRQSALTILPSVNMVRNIGLVGDGTHRFSTGQWWTGLDARGMPFPLRHPDAVVRDKSADGFVELRVMRGGAMHEKILRRFRNALWRSGNPST